MVDTAREALNPCWFQLSWEDCLARRDIGSRPQDVIADRNSNLGPDWNTMEIVIEKASDPQDSSIGLACGRPVQTSHLELQAAERQFVVSEIENFELDVCSVQSVQGSLKRFFDLFRY